MKIAVVSLLLTLGASSAMAQSLGFAHSQAITLRDTSGVALTNYQVRVTINTALHIARGEMKADASDIAFIAPCGVTQTPLAYWVKPDTVNTAATVIWVRVPNIAASATTNLVMLYGKADAVSTSSLDAVFSSQRTAFTQNASAPSFANSDLVRGARFQTNAPVILTEIGKREPAGADRTLVLWDALAGTTLYTTNIAGPATDYTYATLPEVIELSANRDYLLTIAIPNASQYFLSSDFQTDSALTFLDTRYCNECTASTYPTFIAPGVIYGYPNLRFYAGAARATPEVEVATAQSCEATAACNTSCTASVCGDGERNRAAGEECDDGNTRPGDGCASDCTFELGHGDGDDDGQGGDGNDARDDDDDGCSGSPATATSFAALIGLVTLMRRRRSS